MILTNYTTFRKDLAKILDKVVEDSEQAFITRPGGKNVVVISQEEYESWKETEYLLSTEKNRSRLAEGLKEFSESKFDSSFDVKSFISEKTKGIKP